MNKGKKKKLNLHQQPTMVAAFSFSLLSLSLCLSIYKSCDTVFFGLQLVQTCMGSSILCDEEKQAAVFHDGESAAVLVVVVCGTMWRLICEKKK
jgi:hypothetical protein